MDYMYRGVIDDHPETSQPTRKLDRYPQKIDRYGRYALLDGRYELPLRSGARSVGRVTSRPTDRARGTDLDGQQLWR